ncbi:MAG: XylR family transcriptional regulator [Phycisphaerae bacterium]
MAEIRIAVVLDLAVGYRESVIRGLWRFLGTRPDWRTQGVLPKAEELNVLRKWEPDAVIVGIHDLDMAQALRKFKVPIIDVFNWFDLPNVTRVCMDDKAVGRMAAEYLLSCGLKSFAVIGDPAIRFAAQRYDGFSERIAGSGFPCARFDASHLMTPWSSDFGAGPDAALRQQLGSLPKPSGIFAVNDDWAIKVIQLCNQEMIRVPEDMAVLGVDNDELLCQMSRPPLSSIDTGAERVGWQAGSTLAELLDGKIVSNPTLLQPIRVVGRQSSDMFAIEDMEVLTAIRFIQANAHRGIGVSETVRFEGNLP